MVVLEQVVFVNDSAYNNTSIFVTSVTGFCAIRNAIVYMSMYSALQNVAQEDKKSLRKQYSQWNEHANLIPVQTISKRTNLPNRMGPLRTRIESIRA
jgi:hypothetical protein